MIRYMNLGGEKILSSIVMAGSHDAGISEGGQNAQTQGFSIGLQALMGVRLFDVRASAFFVNGAVEMKTFHGPKVSGFTNFTPKSNNRAVPNSLPVKAQHMMFGTTGQDLDSIFLEAKNFVSTTGEFILLKFDKSDHFPVIARMARDIIGNQHLYMEDGCLNEMQLRDMAGKVFVLIMGKDWGKMQPAQRAGTLPIYKLKDEKSGIIKKRVTVATYNAGAPGLQYVGQGGTNPIGFNVSHKSTMKENISNQTKLLNKLKEKAGLSQGGEYLMGMMYWTATGTFRSIEHRNNYLWKHSDKLKELWQSGLGDFTFSRLPPNVVANVNQQAAGHIWKRCMPNFVMIDFANQQKCNTIYQFNLLPAVQLVQFEL